MGIPLTPILQTIQATGSNKTNGASIQDKVQEVIQLLDEFTLNPEEARILAIISELSPEEFIVFINTLARSEYEEYNRNPNITASRSYLQKLYEDINGDEFVALNVLMKSKLLAYKIGDIKNFSTIIQAVLSGDKSSELAAAYKTYEPPGITTPSSWTDGSFFAYGFFKVNGELQITWYKRTGLFTYNDYIRDTLVLKPTDLVVLTHMEMPGKVEFTTVLELLNLSDKAHRNRLFDTVNIIGIIFGAAAIAAAKGVAKQAVIGLFQVAIPSAGQYINEHEAQIMKMSHGREFLIAFQVFNLSMAAYGIIRVLGSGGKFIRDRLRKTSNDLSANNPTDDIAQNVSMEISKVDDAMDEVKSKVVDQGTGSSSTGGQGPGPRPRPRQQIDPNYPPPAHIPDNGQAIATASKEEEIFYELSQLSAKRRDAVDVFQKDADGSYLMVEYHPSVKLRDTNVPSGYSRHYSFKYVLIISPNKSSAQKRYFDELQAGHNRGDLTEFGLYEKLQPDGTVQYAVTIGIKEKVTAPPGWENLAHNHPGAHLEPGYHYAAPEDFRSVNTGKKIRTQSIHSFDKSGRLVETKFGKDTNGYFVQEPSGNKIWFRNMYDENATVAASSPLTINEKLIALQDAKNSGTLSEEALFLEQLKVFRQIDPALNYAGWWARNFTLLSSP